MSSPVTPKTFSLHGSLEGSPAQVGGGPGAQVCLLPLSRFPDLGFPGPFPKSREGPGPPFSTVGGRLSPLCPPSSSDWTNNPADMGRAHRRKPKYISMWGSTRAWPPAPRSIRPRRLPCHGELREGGLWFGTSEGRRQFPRRQGGSCLASRCELGHLSQWDAEDLDQRGLAGPLPARHVTAPVVLCDARSLPRPGPLSEFF